MEDVQQQPYMAKPVMARSAGAVPPRSFMANAASASVNAAAVSAAAAIPGITAILVTQGVNRIVNIIFPAPHTEREKLYKDAHKIIDASNLPGRAAYAEVESVLPPEEREDPTAWITHVERAKSELESAHEKVKCGKCKKEIGAIKKTLDSRTGELVENARRHSVMVDLQKAGKVAPGKIWGELSAKEKSMVKKEEAKRHGR